MTDDRDASLALALWAEEAPDHLHPGRTFRLRALCYLLGLERFHLQVPEPEPGQPYLPDYFPAGDPIPEPLCQWIEERMEDLHAPSLKVLDQVSTYLLPPWLLRIRPNATDSPADGIRVEVFPSDPVSTRIENPRKSDTPSPEVLHSILLLPQVRSERRRVRLWEHASVVARRLEAILGREPFGRAWLREMIDDPESSEGRALEVWSSFVSEFDLPESLRAKGRVISLRDQLILDRSAARARPGSSSKAATKWKG